EKPPRSFIQSLESWWLDATGCAGFEIRPSDTGGGKTAIIMPDLATCPDCLREIFDPRDRRHLYPFTNCTHCGPRFSIVESLPYDRANTSMKKFALCPECAREYRDPQNRRFHAQPNACPICGPHLELWDPAGAVLAARHEALVRAAQTIRAGRILALKGVGGFQLIVAAGDADAVRRLRQRKQREEKPLALMYPSLEAVRADCRVSDAEARLLLSPESPIVLLQKGASQHSPGCMERTPLPNPLPTAWGEGISKLHGSSVKMRPLQRLAAPAPSIAPDNPNLGVMLPYSPLHHLLMAELRFPIVATSGNLSDEPICIDEREALQRLRDIADFFLVHDRPIVRHVDDSVARVVLGREQVLRRARGYAPLPLRLVAGRPAPPLGAASPDLAHLDTAPDGWNEPLSLTLSPLRGARESANRMVAVPKCASPILAVGGHLKNTVALAIGPQVFMSQHIGDLETAQSHEAFLRVIADFQRLYEAEPRTIASDGHPGYLSTQFARSLLAGRPGRRGVSVQHHIAHVLACVAENELAPPVLGVSWDGTGYGSDGTVWGGEFFLVTETACRRVAHFRQFRLPGGEQAVKEPRRAALGLLYELFGETRTMNSFTSSELKVLAAMLKRGINSPLTSSAGRLFDAVAALLGLRQIVRFEGQAAMELEFAIAGVQTDESYPFALIAAQPASDERLRVVDWGPIVAGVLGDLRRGLPVGAISAKFHNSLAEVIVAVARQAGQPQVALSGGCFQNRYLTERAAARLEQEGFRPYWHQRVPPNDGGIALGQIVATLMGVT
ncbi:MAG: carbamoyltransferase HypF, partial [Verrucomicrobiota bacterium]